MVRLNRSYAERRFCWLAFQTGLSTSTHSSGRGFACAGRHCTSSRVSVPTGVGANSVQT